MSSVHYDISIVEHENGWRVTGFLFNGWGLDQALIGSAEAKVFGTRKEAFNYAESVLATLSLQKVEGAHP